MKFLEQLYNWDIDSLRLKECVNKEYEGQRRVS